ncbi:HIPK4 kinase, partial [Atractosteus spatula]|nr:HIPK4 kinase [Atractosteus spatula]
MSVLCSETEVYELVETLGRGTFGEVAKYWRRSTGEMVAIKSMRADAQRSRVIANELKLLAVLSRARLDRCPIVLFQEAFRDARQHYLVFELLEQNLFQLLRERGFRPLAARHIRAVARQLLGALARLKELSVIHADLKPENVMLVDHGRWPFRVKLIDFGSASIFSEVRFVREPYIQSRFYRSPEVLLGLPFCEKVDMWSLGCVTAELLLGWPLYPGDSEFEQVRLICRTQGLPRAHLLDTASKAHLFFQRGRSCRGAVQWQLKPDPQGPPEQSRPPLASLDQLASVHPPEDAPEFLPEDVAAEASDRRSLVELLKRMLTLDSHQRINPRAALRHPFVSMQHLQASPRPTRYHRLSLLAFWEAALPAGGEEQAERPPSPPPIDQMDSLRISRPGEEEAAAADANMGTGGTGGGLPAPVSGSAGADRLGDAAAGAPLRPVRSEPMVAGGRRGGSRRLEEGDSRGDLGGQEEGEAGELCEDPDAEVRTSGKHQPCDFHTSRMPRALQPHTGKERKHAGSSGTPTPEPRSTERVAGSAGSEVTGEGVPPSPSMPVRQQGVLCGRESHSTLADRRARGTAGQTHDPGSNLEAWLTEESLSATWMFLFQNSFAKEPPASSAPLPLSQLSQGLSLERHAGKRRTAETRCLLEYGGASRAEVQTAQQHSHAWEKAAWDRSTVLEDNSEAHRLPGGQVAGHRADATQPDTPHGQSGNDPTTPGGGPGDTRCSLSPGSCACCLSAQLPPCSAGNRLKDPTSSPVTPRTGRPAVRWARSPGRHTSCELARHLLKYIHTCDDALNTFGLNAAISHPSRVQEVVRTSSCHAHPAGRCLRPCWELRSAMCLSQASWEIHSATCLCRGMLGDPQGPAVGLQPLEQRVCRPLHPGGSDRQACPWPARCRRDPAGRPSRRCADPRGRRDPHTQSPETPHDNGNKPVNRKPLISTFFY